MGAKNVTDTQIPDKIRKDHNKDLIRRMRNGESLTSFDSQSSWFPPRPILEKDNKAIAKLYGENKASKAEEKKDQDQPKKPQILKIAKD